MIPPEPSALRAAIRALNVDQADPELIVGYPPSKASKKIAGGVVRIDPALGTVLREIAVETLADLKDRDWRTYDPRSNITKHEAEFAEGAVIDADSELFGLLAAADVLNPIGATALVEHKPKLYAIGFAVGEEFVYFVRRRFEQVIGTGKVRTVLFGDALHLADQPAFLFDPEIELIVHPLGVVVLNSTAFAGLVRAKEVVAAQVAADVQAMAAVLPFDAATLARLLERGQRPLVRRRLRNIVDRGFAGLNLDRIVAGFAHQGIDPADFVNADGALAFGAENALRFVKFLNDETFVAEFSGQLQAADGVGPW